MTVPVPGSLTYSYDEDGITTVFAYPVRFFEPQELEVVREVGGVRTTLTYNVDYTVSGAGSPSGGSITRAAATDGGKIIITRNTAWKQSVDLTNNGRNPAESVEQQLDRLTMAGQDSYERFSPLADKADDLDNAVALANAAANAAEQHKQAAEDAQAAAEGAAAGVNLPTIGTGDAGKSLVVKQTEDGYELLDERGVVRVANRTALKALDSISTPVAIIYAEGGRNGTFAFVGGDQSANVAADPSEGIYVAPTSDPTGASGAWVRQGFKAFDIRWFGAACDGTSDDTTAFQAALDLANAEGGWSVFVPPGDTAVQGTITLPGGVTVFGSDSDYGRSRIVCGNATDDLFVATSKYGIVFRDLTVTSSVTKTAGAYFNYTAVYGAKFINVHFNKEYQGAALDGTVGVEFNFCTFSEPVPSSISFGGCMVRLKGDVNVETRFVGVLARAVDLADMPSYGIWAQSTDAMQIIGCDIIRRGTCLWMNPQSGQAVAATYAVASYFDNATAGVQAEPASGGSIIRARFSACWSADHTVAAWRFVGSGTIGSFGLDGCFGLNSLHGILYEREADLQVMGGVYAGNANGFTDNGAGGGFALIGAKFGSTAGPDGNQAGISFAGAADNFQIVGCDIRGNTVATIFGLPSIGSTRIVRSNLGFVSEATGSATIADGTTSIVVNHGLSATPSTVVVTPQGNIGAATRYWISGKTSTQFTINVDADPTYAVPFAWSATA